MKASSIEAARGAMWRRKKEISSVHMDNDAQTIGYDIEFEYDDETKGGRQHIFLTFFVSSCMIY